MPVMRRRDVIPSNTTSGNLIQGQDFEFVTDSVISLWASSGGFAISTTLQVGTTVLGRDMQVNVRPSVSADGNGGATTDGGINPNFNNVLANEDQLIFRELVEGTARLTLTARNNGGTDRSLNWMLEVQPIGGV